MIELLIESRSFKFMLKLLSSPFLCCLKRYFTNNTLFRRDMPKNKSTALSRSSDKKRKTLPQISYPEWVSASKTRNYLLKDPVLDYFDMYGKSKGFIPDEETNSEIQNKLDFGRFIMNQGTEFEKYMIIKIKEKVNQVKTFVEKKENPYHNDEIEFPKTHFVEIKAQYLDPIPKILEMFTQTDRQFLQIPKHKWGKNVGEILENLKSADPELVKECFPTYADDLQKVLSNHIYRNTMMELEDTLEAMKKGIPIIYQGLVCDPQNKTYGYPDLLVRSDYLPYLVTHFPYVAKEKCKFSQKDKSRWHYCVIDIKFSTLHLRVDEEHLLNQGSVPAYKGQLAIYNQALQFMQNYIPEEAYLLGRGWSSTHSQACDSFDRLGVVNFKGVDELVPTEALAAIDWVRDLRIDGNKWNLDPPSRNELYPNMCNSSDNGWHRAKKNLADSLKDITSIWQCGIKQRDTALSLPESERFTSWTDPKCTAMSLGMKEKGAYTSIVDRILRVNRDETSQPILYQLPPKDKKSINWRMNVKNFVGFIDIETVSNIGSIEGNDQQSLIFMIGLYYLDFPIKKGIYTKEKYKVWIVNKVNPDEELIIINKFIDFVNEKACGRYVTLYHYSHAETTSFKNAYAFHKISAPKFEWIDLFTMVKENNIVIKGALDFSLKTIVGSLNKLGKIDVGYEESEISSGLQAMVAVFYATKEYEEMDIPFLKIH